MDFGRERILKELDDAVRTAIRDYRVKHGMDPKAFKIDRSMYATLHKEYKSSVRMPTPWQAGPLGVSTLYGIPVIVEGGRVTDFDKNGCRTESVGF